jgi:hypothetical protein
MTGAARHIAHIVMGSSQQGYILMKGGINARLKVVLALISSHEKFWSRGRGDRG